MNLNFTFWAQVVMFALFIYFCVKKVWPPLLRAIENRQKQISEGLAEAEKGKASLADAKVQTDALLKEARDRAQEIVAQAEKQASQRIEESKGAAKAAIEQEVQSAKAQLREQVALLAVSGAEKILKREVDARAHADMLNQLKAQL